MIIKDQPTIFPSHVKVVFSSVDDGSISAGAGNPPLPEHLLNRTKLLKNNDFLESQTAILFITYGDDRTYTDIVEVTDENTGTAIKADAIFTYTSNIPLYLPVADCIATVIFDPNLNLLAVLHLGRHSSQAGLIEKFAYTVSTSSPQNWLVWMSPSVQKLSNKLHYFELKASEEWKPFITQAADDYLVDIPAHNKAAFMKLGVKSENIEVSSVDTYVDENYYSHRAANELGRPKRQGRMAVIAMMR